MDSEKMLCGLCGGRKLSAKGRKSMFKIRNEIHMNAGMIPVLLCCFITSVCFNIVLYDYRTMQVISVLRSFFPLYLAAAGFWLVKKCRNKMDSAYGGILYCLLYYGIAAVYCAFGVLITKWTSVYNIFSYGMMTSLVALLVLVPVLDKKIQKNMTVVILLIMVILFSAEMISEKDMLLCLSGQRAWNRESYLFASIVDSYGISPLLLIIGFGLGADALLWKQRHIPGFRGFFASVLAVCAGTRIILATATQLVLNGGITWYPFCYTLSLEYLWLSYFLIEPNEDMRKKNWPIKYAAIILLFDLVIVFLAAAAVTAGRELFGH